ncbi:aldo/keto reductase [Kushneria pakistanensis]|nr:aldo/keto reductase [Kushneria pakistanensis]
MEYVKLPGTDMTSSALALGTWPIGGALWGGTDEQKSLRTLQRAFDSGFTCIDTANDYGYGKAQELVGRAVKQAGNRDRILLSDKCAINWTQDGSLYRDGSRARLTEEIDLALKRLQTDYIDIFHVHWPDPSTPMAETAEAMRQIKESGRIRAVGVSNFTVDQIAAFEQVCPVDVIQPPFNLFEQQTLTSLEPVLEGRDIAVMTYSALCRGLLSTAAPQDKDRDIDVRSMDPKFQSPHMEHYQQAVQALDTLARERFDKRVIHLALRWLIDRGETHLPIWAARDPEQLNVVSELWDFQIDDDTMREIDRIIAQHIGESFGPEGFMAPPLASEL